MRAICPLLLGLLSACSMTSDLDELRQRAEAARLAGPDCVNDPFDPLCQTPSVAIACGDTANCTGYCDSQSVCRPLTCRDTMQSPGETAVDCGGNACAPCGNGLGCLVPSDCQSARCEGGMCLAGSSAIPNGMTMETPDAGGSPFNPQLMIPDGQDAMAPGGCPQGCHCTTTLGEERVYCDELELNWMEAAAWCEMHGYVLSQVESRAENDALGNTAEALQIPSFWLGASDRSQEGMWIWAGGTSLWQGGPATCAAETSMRGENDRCYDRTSSSTYLQAHDDCLAMGTGWSLVVIDSADENTIVKDVVNGTGQTTGWIGANDLATEGSWGWLTGAMDATEVTPFWIGPAGGDKVDLGDYVNWGCCDPSSSTGENCAYLTASSGEWADGACDYNGRIGICEGPLSGPLPEVFNAFAESEPMAADCLSYQASDMRWYARDCSLPQAFVCTAP